MTNHPTWTNGRALVLGLLTAGLTVATVVADGPEAGGELRNRGAQVKFEKIDVLSLRHPSPPTQRACDGLVAHTDANFAGGTFVAQAGMGQGEAFGASYVLPASAFPIRITLTEVIMVTSGADVPTTTHWSVLFYRGVPTTGTLVATYSSNGLDLPHVELPAGTNGINVQFSIDPNDPEQIDITDDGSHTFTFAFRIDQHNNQTQNPCFFGPDPNFNAFLCTDTSGLAQPANNWLFGLNCGPFGCPANGGWARFSALPGGCRPSGDWVARVSYRSLECQPGVGACCKTDGSCELRTLLSCQSISGTFRGEGTSCPTANCPQPVGACCFGTACLNFSEADCNLASGTWLGAGTSCAPNDTCPTGACCKPDGTCVGGVTSAACAAMSGTFRGVGSNCNDANCPQPVGACCLSNGNCLSLTQANCGVIPNTHWAGALTTCPSGCQPPCPGDCDGNRAVNQDDLDIVLFSFGTCPGDPGYLAGANVEPSSPCITQDDLDVVLFYFGGTCP